MSTKVASARYMTRFQCLAGDCEATCCGGWGIAVEPLAHRRLKVLAAGDSALQELLQQGIEVTPGGPDYARLRFLPSGGCSMLDDLGLCRIHAKFGHAELFEVCAAYPRYANQIDEELELFGTLSCPEIARLALLSDDGFEITSDTLDEPPRKLRNRFDTQKPYFRPFKLVRDAMLQLLSEPGYGLSEKLFVLLWMSDKLRLVLHAGCSKVPESELRSIFGALAEAPVLGTLTSSFRSLTLDGALPLLVLHAALQPASSAHGGAQTDRFDALLRQVWGTFGLASKPSEAELLTVWTRYAALRGTIPGWARARVDLCLTRYAKNHVLTTPYMLSENLFAYVYDLVVRLASLRFLLQTRLANFAGSSAELDQGIVEITFAFARAVEHADLPQRLQATLALQGLDGLAHAACFLTV